MTHCLALLVTLAPCHLARLSFAKEAPPESIRAVRQEIVTIRAEILRTEPYPSGQRWEGQLRDLHEKLTQMGGGDSRRYLWFKQAIADFRLGKKDDALRILDDLIRRLTLLEDSMKEAKRPEARAREERSPDAIKSLLRGSEGRRVERKQTYERVEEDRSKARREEARGKDPDREDGPPGGGRGTIVSVPAAEGSGFTSLGWLLLGGIALAVVVVGAYRYLTSPRSPKSLSEVPTPNSVGQTTEKGGHQVFDESPASLRRQADTLANDGRFREAVRTLYLAVIAVLHQRHLIRFEPTRTNGEYVRQVRFAELAPAELPELFYRLTQFFETAWYGERSCTSNDYRSARTLAEQVQRMAATSG
jgi:hypothetical protein